MKRTKLQMSVGVLAAAVLSLGGGGCVQSSGTVSITGAIDLNSGTAPTCVPSGTYRARGVLDLKSGRGYTAALELVNGIPQTASAQVLQQDQTRSPNYQNYGSAEANTIRVQSATVTVQSEAGEDLGLGNREVAANGAVTNTGFAVGSSFPVFVQMISLAEAKALRAYASTVEPGIETNPNLTVAVQSVAQIFTSTSGGGGDQTALFTLPIDLCVGCLVDVGVDFIDDNGTAVCRNPAFQLREDGNYNACVPAGQDIVFTRCQEAN